MIALHAVATSDNLLKSIKMFEKNLPLLHDCHFVFDAENGPLPGYSVNFDFTDGSAIRSLFKSPKVFVLDYKTIRAMQTGTASFKVDYSISLDTQALSYLEPFLEKRTSKLPKDFDEIFKFISKDETSIDPLPYMHENYINLKDPQKANKIFQKIKAYEVLKSLNYKMLSEQRLLESYLNDLELNKNAQESIAFMYQDLSNSTYFDTIRTRVFSYYALLLKMIYIQIYSPKKSTYNKLIEFLDFSHSILSTMFFRETLISNNFFDKGQDFGFFSKIQKNKTDLFEVALGMAWDLYHIRQLELGLTIRPDSTADYFFPSLLSCDKRLAEVMHLYPLHCCAYVKDSFYPIPFYNTDIIESMTCTEDQKNSIKNRYFSQNAIAERDKKRKQAIVDLADSVRTLEKELSQVANVKINDSVIERFKL